MALPWADHQPIYRQLRERIIGLLLSGTLLEGEALPSVRQLAGECQINHLTVSKAYQELVEMRLVEIKRGVGMYIVKGAQKKLLAIEKQKFINLELPNLLKRSAQLGLTIDELYHAIRELHEEH
jgi:GntR family transcriptional regulator